MIAIRGADEKLTVLDEREKKAKVWTHQSLLQQEAEGKGQGIAMLGSGFSDSIAAFEKQFEITDVEPVATLPGDYIFTLKLRDRTATVFVKNVVITVGMGDGSMRSFVILMRDGSRMETVVRKYKLNSAIDPGVFRVDVTGYQVEEVKPDR